jgi:hypothetical protein
MGVDATLDKLAREARHSYPGDVLRIATSSCDVVGLERTQKGIRIVATRPYKTLSSSSYSREEIQENATCEIKQVLLNIQCRKWRIHIINPAAKEK